MRLFTIGFTKKTAEQFFGLLKGSGAQRVVDVRLNNVSQLAGFSKRDDLRFLLKAVCGMGYAHLPALAPTQDILDEFKKAKGDWSIYEAKFLELMTARRIEQAVSPAELDGGCLLCSEDKPKHCHRRLVAEYLQRAWGSIEIVHL